MAQNWFDKRGVRQVEEILYSYREYMHAIEGLEPRLISTIRQDPVFNKTRNIFSQTEEIALRRTQFPEPIQIIREKKEQLTPTKQKILEMKYFHYQYDYQIWKEIKINNNQYYQLRKEIIMFFAEAFNIKIENNYRKA